MVLISLPGFCLSLIPLSVSQAESTRTDKTISIKDNKSRRELKLSEQQICQEILLFWNLYLLNIKQTTTYVTFKWAVWLRVTACI